MTFRAYTSSIGRMRMLAGDPALDFANTFHWRGGREVDFIPDYVSLVDWSVPAGLLQPDERDAWPLPPQILLRRTLSISKLWW